MKKNPHSIQVIRIAHRIISHMNQMIESFHNDDEHWKTPANLLKYEAESFQLHYTQHCMLVKALKEEEE